MKIFILSDSKVVGAAKLPVIWQRYFPPPHNLREYDFLIFTSKNGVKAVNHYTDAWKNIPSLAIGKATAKVIEELGGRVAYVAKSFYGEDFIQEIAQQFGQENRFLYLRAKTVVTEMTVLAKRFNIMVDEAVVYETLCVECQNLQAPPKGSTIIFSSPSTIRCFFRCFTWDSSYKAVAIGKKTAAHLPQNIPFRLYEQKSLQEIVAILQKA